MPTLSLSPEWGLDSCLMFLSVSASNVVLLGSVQHITICLFPLSGRLLQAALHTCPVAFLPSTAARPPSPRRAPRGPVLLRFCPVCALPERVHARPRCSRLRTPVVCKSSTSPKSSPTLRVHIYMDYKTMPHTFPQNKTKAPTWSCYCTP